MSDLSLVATFREKVRPIYYNKTCAANSRYIKENVYFNGIALKESLLHNNNECPDTQTPKHNILFGHNKTQQNDSRCFEPEEGCFIYQNPTSHCEDNDFVHQFTEISLAHELNNVNQNLTSSLDSETYKMVKLLSV